MVLNRLRQGLGKLIGEKKDIPTEIDEGPVVEVPVELEKQYFVRVVRIGKLEEGDKLLPLLKDYVVVFINIQGFQNKDNLKRCITKLKMDAERTGAAIYGIDSNWLALGRKEIFPSS